MYDVCLSWECAQLPNLTDLAQHIPQVTEPAFQQLLTQPVPARPVFVGLDLSRSLAFVLLQRLRTTGAVGVVVHATYRHPTIEISQAATLAAQSIQQRREQHFPEYHFQFVSFQREKATTWTFFAASEQLLWEGHIPGGLFADVDKLDGHIWLPEEFEQLARE